MTGAMGTVGSPIGAAVGAAGGMISSVTNLIGTGVRNQEEKRLHDLQQKALASRSDTIYGDPGTSSLILKVKAQMKLVTNTGNEIDRMMMEYNRRGHPTALYVTIDSRQ